MIEELLRELNDRLHLSGRARARIVDEVSDHLQDAVADLQSRGLDSRAAREQAVSAFGLADDLARQFNAEAATTTMRRTPVVIGASAVTMVGGFLLAATTQPQPKVPAPAGAAVQVSFFVAMLGLQVAAVAGARAAARVAARWRTVTASTADREVVRSAAVICVSGLAVAALGWTVAVTFAIDQRPHVRPMTGLAGSLLMISAAVVAVACVGRRPIPEGDNSLDGHTELSGPVLGLGERVIQVIQRWPATLCAAVALLAALSAMSHAETTLTAALPWGGIEAAAVVAGFVFLGPRLGLVASATPPEDSPMTTSPAVG